MSSKTREGMSDAAEFYWNSKTDLICKREAAARSLSVPLDGATHRLALIADDEDRRQNLNLWTYEYKTAGLVLQNCIIPGVPRNEDMRGPVKITVRPKGHTYSWLRCFDRCCDRCGELLSREVKHDCSMELLDHEGTFVQLAPCRHCGEEVPSLAELRLHQESCTALLPSAPFAALRCDDCGLRFTLPSALRGHTADAHSPPAAPDTAAPSEPATPPSLHSPSDAPLSPVQPPDADAEAASLEEAADDARRRPPRMETGGVGDPPTPVEPEPEAPVAGLASSRELYPGSSDEEFHKYEPRKRPKPVRRSVKPHSLPGRRVTQQRRWRSCSSERGVVVDELTEMELAERAEGKRGFFATIGAPPSPPKAGKRPRSPMDGLEGLEAPLGPVSKRATPAHGLTEDEVADLAGSLMPPADGSLLDTFDTFKD